jgi:ATP phosphoribosyltransferase
MNRPNLLTAVALLSVALASGCAGGGAGTASSSPADLFAGGNVELNVWNRSDRVLIAFARWGATTYPNILARYLRQNDVQAEIVTLSGAVEIAPRLGRADFICDLVSTGSTLVANHLWEADTILESQAAIISTPVPVAPEKQDWIHRLSMRIDGVQQVKESKYNMLHAPRSALAAIKKLLPGSESPTIVPLDGVSDKVAVHAVCRENVFWETLESLKSAGASAILVLPVEKMLA